MKRLLTLFFAALLAACASQPPMPSTPERTLFNDSAFRKPEQAAAPEQIFALTPEMKAYAEKIRQGRRNGKTLQAALFEALYEHGQLQLEYDSRMTRTAAQAFEARSGNCLSLVIMTAAFAHELGLEVQFQRITIDDTWSRNGSVYFSTGHVNLVLRKSGLDKTSIFDRSGDVTVDFLPPPDAERLPTEAIAASRIVAMYMSNRAVETMVEGKLDDAYWWARAAIEADPGHVGAYNTLSAVYQRHGDTLLAYNTLHFALQHEPRNTVVMSNLVEVARQLGYTAEAAKLKDELEGMEGYPPFYFFNLGQQAMAQGDYRKARSMFVREVQRAPYYHEFHFWLAKAAFELGDLKEADKHMALALDNSTTRSDTAIYASKLAHLRLYESSR